jgi:hypothetical protein
MATKQALKRIEELISQMEQNHFLLPDSWSSEIQMANHDWSYKTYVSAPRNYGNKRYIVLEIKDLDIKVTFHLGEIKHDHVLGGKTIKPQDLLFYIEEIYKEKHSFDNHVDGKRKIREEIKILKSKIKRIEENIQGKKQELEGIENLKNK